MTTNKAVYAQDCHANPDSAHNYGHFFDLERLVAHFRITNTSALAKLARLNLACPLLRQYFTPDELRDVEPLVQLLLAKSSPTPHQPQPQLQPKTRRHIAAGAATAAQPRRRRRTLDSKLLRQSELTAISKKELTRYVMYLK